MNVRIKPFRYANASILLALLIFLSGPLFAQDLSKQDIIDQRTAISTDTSLTEDIRTELLAQKMRSLMQAGLFVAPYGAIIPGQAWEYYGRLNRRVKAEIIPLTVAWRQGTFVAACRSPR